MAWVAEILRKDHRTCQECGLGPTHVYDPIAQPGLPEIDLEAGAAGSPLCNTCLVSRLEQDLSASRGRVVVIEPALGPDGLIFRDINHRTGRAWSETEKEEIRALLARMDTLCSGCGGHGGFLWVPVEPDANLWLEDWLPCLADGRLAPEATLCGRCTARRLGRTLEDRGLFLDAIVPPRTGDGLFCGAEAY